MTTPTTDTTTDASGCMCIPHLHGWCAVDPCDPYRTLCGVKNPTRRSTSFRVPTCERCLAILVPPAPVAPIAEGEMTPEQLIELRKWWDAFGSDNTPEAVSKMCDETLDLRQQLAAANARAEEAERATSIKHTSLQACHDLIERYESGLLRLLSDKVGANESAKVVVREIWNANSGPFMRSVRAALAAPAPTHEAGGENTNTQEMP